MISEISTAREVEPRALWDEARRFVRRQLPGAFEADDEVAGIVTYSYGGDLSDLACMVAPHSNGLMIGFYNADDLGDSARLLHRRGTRHRYVEIDSLKDLYAPALDELLSAVRRRHGDSAASLDGVRDPASRPSPRSDLADRPAAETLVSLLIGLMTGALFAEALDSRTAGLTLGLMFVVALLWVRRSRNGSSS